MNEQESKQQILKSTSILGSVQVIGVIIGVIRAKMLAVLLGPSGIGIFGIYQTTISIISSATGLGLNYSGVRDISAAVATDNQNKITRTVLILRRWALVTGLVGMALMLIFSKLLSFLSFGNESYSCGIAAISITLLLSSVTGGMNAELQGMRKIKELAKANIIGATLGLISTIFICYYLRVRGIVLALLLNYLIIQIVTWYFARDAKLSNVKLNIQATYKGGLSMAKLGFFMVIAASMNNLFMFAARSFIVQQGGLESVGQFIAAWTISSMYISAIFGAMGADFYPRLCLIKDDHTAVNRLVNEQTEVALLLSVPIIIGLISYIRLVVNIFYSKNFGATIEILSWQLFGDFFKVLGYSIGYILLAQAKGKLLILGELLWNIIYLGLIYFGWTYFGIEISGIAFLIAYITHISIIYFFVKREVKFNWSANVLQYIIFFLPVLMLSFLSSSLLTSGWLTYSIGSVLFLGSSLFSFYHLRKIVDFNVLFQKLRYKVKSN